MAIEHIHAAHGEPLEADSVVHVELLDPRVDLATAEGDAVGY